jgi:brefeldin A-inhibited guanine nucleotide-exchange protein
MIFVRLFQFKRQVGLYYPFLCEMICLELKAELRAVLRKVFSRIGPAFGVCPPD